MDQQQREGGRGAPRYSRSPRMCSVLAMTLACLWCCGMRNGIRVCAGSAWKNWDRATASGGGGVWGVGGGQAPVGIQIPDSVTP